MRARLLTCLATALLATALCTSLAAAHPKGRGAATYRGKTAQNRPITIKVGAGSLTLQSFRIRMLCPDGSFFFAAVSGFEPTSLKGGRFVDVQYGATDVVEWEGVVRPSRVVGRLQIKDRLPSGVRCGSGPVRFSAGASGRSRGRKG